MLSYPVRLAPEGDDCVMLTIPDIPEVVVVGASEDEVFMHAVPLLETVLGGYLDEGRPIPSPSDICGAPTVTTSRFEG